MALAPFLNAEDIIAPLARWWAQREPGRTNVTITGVDIPRANGMSSETVLFTASWRENGVVHERELVARVIPPGGSIFPTYDFKREAQAMTATRTTTSAPAPEVLGIEEDPAILGAPFLLMQRLHGRVLPDDPPFTVASWFLELDPAGRRKVIDNAVATIVEIQHADTSAMDPGTLGHPSAGSDPFTQQVQYWRGLYEAWGGCENPHPVIESAFDWIAQNTPAAPDEIVISWGDARLANVMFNDHLEVTGVLDWELVALGAREIDLAWFLFIVRFYTEGIGVAVPDGHPSRDEIIEHYTRLSGHTPDNLEPYEVLAALRVSIVIMRFAMIMIQEQQLPPDATMALSNPASRLLAAMLDLPIPSGDVGWVDGHR